MGVFPSSFSPFTSYKILVTNCTRKNCWQIWWFPRCLIQWQLTSSTLCNDNLWSRILHQLHPTRTELKLRRLCSFLQKVSPIPTRQRLLLAQNPTFPVPTGTYCGDLSKTTTFLERRRLLLDRRWELSPIYWLGGNFFEPVTISSNWLRLFRNGGIYRLDGNFFGLDCALFWYVGR